MYKYKLCNYKQCDATIYTIHVNTCIVYFYLCLGSFYIRYFKTFTKESNCMRMTSTIKKVTH